MSHHEHEKHHGKSRKGATSGVEKEKKLEVESKKQVLAGKMGKGKLDYGQWPRAKTPQFLESYPKGKGEKASWEQGGTHRLPKDDWEI